MRLPTPPARRMTLTLAACSVLYTCTAFELLGRSVVRLSSQCRGRLTPGPESKTPPKRAGQVGAASLYATVWVRRLLLPWLQLASAAVPFQLALAHAYGNKQLRSLHLPAAVQAAPATPAYFSRGSEHQHLTHSWFELQGLVTASVCLEKCLPQRAEMIRNNGVAADPGHKSEARTTAGLSTCCRALMTTVSWMQISWISLAHWVLLTEIAEAPGQQMWLVASGISSVSALYA